jgi:hypothetical protein
MPGRANQKSSIVPNGAQCLYLLPQLLLVCEQPKSLLPFLAPLYLFLPTHHHVIVLFLTEFLKRREVVDSMSSRFNVLDMTISTTAPIDAKTHV